MPFDCFDCGGGSPRYGRATVQTSVSSARPMRDSPPVTGFSTRVTWVAGPTSTLSPRTGLVTLSTHPGAPDLIVNKQGELVAHTALPPTPAWNVSSISVLESARVPDGLDVAHHRERSRQRRISKLAVLFSLLASLYLWWRILAHLPLSPFAFHLTATQQEMVPSIFIVIILGGALLVPLLGAGRSPHIRYRPSEIDTGSPTWSASSRSRKRWSVRSTCSSRTGPSPSEMGGTPRRGVLFEGPPGTGKTYMAKAMAAEAGVPFLFVSSSAFQSMFYGQTNRKIRSYFRALRNVRPARRAARSASSRRSTPSARSRGGMGSGQRRRRRRRGQRAADPAAVLRPAHRLGRDGRGCFIDVAQPLAARSTPQIRKRTAAAGQHPGHRGDQPGRPTSTRRCCVPAASTVDLLRPARPARAGGDHRLLPRPQGPRAPSSTTERARDALAGDDLGLLAGDDRAPPRRGAGLGAAPGGDRADLGGHPAGQDDRGDRPGPAGRLHRSASAGRSPPTRPATPRSPGWSAESRKLEVLSIIKREDALGLLAHADTEERFTATRSEITGSIQIAFGGMVAEEMFFGESGTGVAAISRPPRGRGARWSAATGMAGSLILRAIEADRSRQGNLVARVLHRSRGRAAVETILDRVQSRRPCAARRATAIVIGAPRRAARPRRADRPRDPRRAERLRGGLIRPAVPRLAGGSGTGSTRRVSMWV